jgi:hypothetical protein
LRWVEKKYSWIFVSRKQTFFSKKQDEQAKELTFIVEVIGNEDKNIE